MPHRRFAVVRGIWRVAAVAIVLLSCVSCARLERVPQPEADGHELIGGQIRVTTRDGEVLELWLLDVTEDAFVVQSVADSVGAPREVKFDNIALVELRSGVDWNWRTFFLVVGGGLVVLAVVIVAGLSQSI